MKTNEKILINPPIDLSGYDLAYLDCSQRYTNGKMAVVVYCSDGERACTVSVNLPEYAHLLSDGEFFLKNWSENRISVNHLIRRGIIKVTDKPAVSTGYVNVSIAKLNK